MDDNCYGEFAQVYDRLIVKDIDYLKYGENINKICHKFKINYDNYLDLACGTGNLTGVLYKYFKKTYAVDLSYDMLSMAQNKLDNHDIQFICQDICSLELNEKFNLITSFLDSVNYITTKAKLKAFFKGCYKHLDSKGIFIFDINSKYKLENILGENTFICDEDEVFYTWENSYKSPVLTMYLSFFLKNGHIYRRFDEIHKERAYEQIEIEDIIKSSGFNILLKLDDYKQKKIMDKTERITYVLGKDI